MDYWYSLDLHHHENWEAFRNSDQAPDGNLWLFSTRGTRDFWDVSYEDGDGLSLGMKAMVFLNIFTKN